MYDEEDEPVTDDDDAEEVYVEDDGEYRDKAPGLAENQFEPLKRPGKPLVKRSFQKQTRTRRKFIPR